MRKFLAGAGLMVYALSFFLWAVTDFRGYYCAAFALVDPWRDGWRWGNERLWEYVSLLLSGWVNPLFLTAVVLGFLRPRSWVAAVFGGLTLLCLPFSWIVFGYEGMYPRAGHVLWVAGIVVTLAAIWLTKSAAAQTRPGTRVMGSTLA
jgi:hypothetical protein